MLFCKKTYSYWVFEHLKLDAPRWHLRFSQVKTNSRNDMVVVKQTKSQKIRSLEIQDAIELIKYKKWALVSTIGIAINVQKLEESGMGLWVEIAGGNN